VTLACGWTRARRRDLLHGGSAWLAEEQDIKWFSRLPVAVAVVEAMASLDLAYWKVDAAKKKELAAGRVALSRER